MFVNAFAVCKERLETIPMLEICRLVVQGLLAQKEEPTPSRQHLFKKKRKIPEKKIIQNKKRQTVYLSKDVILINRGIHWPKCVGSRGRSEVDSLTYQMRSKPFFKYSTCNVFLCYNERKLFCGISSNRL